MNSSKIDDNNNSKMRHKLQMTTKQWLRHKWVMQLLPLLSNATEKSRTEQAAMLNSTVYVIQHEEPALVW